MPTVNLTAQQQATIDTANKTLADAQKAYDSALNNFNSVKDNFCNQGWWSYLNNCDIRNAQSKTLNTTLAIAQGVVIIGQVANLINGWTQKRWDKPSSCQNAIDKGIILKWECHSGTGDCKSKDGCNNRVNQYNDKLSNYYSSLTTVGGAGDLLNSAKDNLNTVLDAIAKDPTTGANAGIINHEIDVQKSKDTIKWLFFGLAAVIIVGGAILIGMRVLSGRASA